ncbi:MAG: hypothetical protein H6587_10720 [Flavobacteriales bacterium]|nr:hypothetical protein [Flavobacteriales bacterium]MCB9365033.1 hypothetical protein [Flavobacteriales bacterium]
MNEEYKNYPDNAKVWVYQAATHLDDDDVNFLKVKIDDFIATWISHGNLLKADFDILHNLFVVLFVDEQGDRMCGSAQDASVRLMKELEEQLETEFLNRMNLSYLNNDKAIPVKMGDFAKLIEEGTITENTLVFNNTITTKKEFDTIFKAPLKNSWQAQLMA